MKKMLVLLLSMLCAPLCTAFAQRIQLGEKAPELKGDTWLDDRRPASAPLTYVEFFHSRSKSGAQALERLKSVSEAMGDKLRVIVITRETEEKIAPLVSAALTRQTGVLLDADGRNFTAYGVEYLPFGVLVDSRNRALWMGNTLQLTPEIIRQSR